MAVTREDSGGCNTVVAEGDCGLAKPGSDAWHLRSTGAVRPPAVFEHKRTPPDTTRHHHGRGAECGAYLVHAAVTSTWRTKKPGNSLPSRDLRPAVRLPPYPTVRDGRVYRIEVQFQLYLLTLLSNKGDSYYEIQTGGHASGRRRMSYNPLEGHLLARGLWATRRCVYPYSLMPISLSHKRNLQF